MADKTYLDREAVLDVGFQTLPLVGTSPAEAMGISRMSAAFYRAVRNIPAADVVPVVRCKDCKHYQITEDGEYACVKDADEKDGVWFGFIQDTPPMWFCADGKRKGDDEK